MTLGRPMDESEGEFRADWKPTADENPAYRCRCGSDRVFYRIWDSDDGAYEDIQYECRSCGRRRWVESSDA
jgi:predicted SprT family Zn-dependent metalloprotease